jgi:hypothetical protein
MAKKVGKITFALVELGEIRHLHEVLRVVG